MAGQNVYKWMAIDRVCNVAMTFGGNIVLAHLLSLTDFGLVAEVYIFVAIAYNFSGCGMSDGLIYKAQPTQRDYSTVFVFNAAFGLAFALLFMGLSGVIARFFNHPEVQGIMVAVGICFFFLTLTFTQETRMRKELDMRGLAIVHLLSTATVTTLGIIMAVRGWGYWALVMTHSGLGVFQLFYYLLVSRWIPKFAFYKDSFKEMFGYGVHLMVAYVVNQIGRNINTSVLGKFASPATSGLYSQAQKLEEVPYSILDNIFNWPFFSVLCNEQSEQKRQQLAAEMHTRMWWVCLSAGALLLLVSWPAFNLLYGAKWDGAVPIFRILLAFGILTSMKYFYQQVLKAYNRNKMVRNLTLIEVALQLGMLFLVFDRGPEMIALTLVVAAVVILGIYAVEYKRLMHTTLRTMSAEFIRSMLTPSLALAVTVAVGSLWYNNVIPLVNCVGLTLTYLICLVGACEILRPSYYLPLRQNVIAQFRKS